MRILELGRKPKPATRASASKIEPEEPAGGGLTAPPHARRSVAHEGTARPVRVPSVDSGDDRYSTAGMGLDWTLIPGRASALIDRRP